MKTAKTTVNPEIFAGHYICGFYARDYIFTNLLLQVADECDIALAYIEL